jgi:predicted DNA-binding WGR domain protein
MPKSSVTVHFGRLGTPGQKHVAKLIAQKTKKGY